MMMMMKFSRRWDTVECVYNIKCWAAAKIHILSTSKDALLSCAFPTRWVDDESFFSAHSCVYLLDVEYERHRTTFTAEWQEGKIWSNKFSHFFFATFSLLCLPLSHHLITLKFSFESAQMLAHRTINQRDFFSREKSWLLSKVSETKAGEWELSGNLIF